jgi:translation initiation factor 1
MSKNTRLVFSSDGSHTKICKKCDEVLCQCKSIQTINPAEILIKLRLEKNGRGGKLVTVLFNFPHNPDYFKKLTKKLKKTCGTGGTYKDDSIEIQGDHKEKLKACLVKLGFQVKFAGG